MQYSQECVNWTCIPSCSLHYTPHDRGLQLRTRSHPRPDGSHSQIHLKVMVGCHLQLLQSVHLLPSCLLNMLLAGHLLLYIESVQRPERLTSRASSMASQASQPICTPQGACWLPGCDIPSITKQSIVACTIQYHSRVYPHLPMRRKKRWQPNWQGCWGLNACPGWSLCTSSLSRRSHASRAVMM